MSDMGDKIKHKAEEVKGRAKQAVGDAKDDPELQAEGRSEELGAHGKQVGDKVEDAVDEAKDAFRKR